MAAEWEHSLTGLQLRVSLPATLQLNEALPLCTSGSTARLKFRKAVQGACRADQMSKVLAVTA